mmetsp:Transcript_48389/g.138302  ORF Transcript_48389/g.138302 Transcript_48389/m.138302 type:complete len:271 (+) Transcript_48389:122-934(+)
MSTPRLYRRRDWRRGHGRNDPGYRDVRVDLLDRGFEPPVHGVNAQRSTRRALGPRSRAAHACLGARRARSRRGRHGEVPFPRCRTRRGVPSTAGSDLSQASGGDGCAGGWGESGLCNSCGRSSIRQGRPNGMGSSHELPPKIQRVAYFFYGCIIIPSQLAQSKSSIVVHVSRRLAFVGDMHAEIEAYTAMPCSCRTESAQCSAVLTASRPPFDCPRVRPDARLCEYAPKLMSRHPWDTDMARSTFFYSADRDLFPSVGKSVISFHVRLYL